MRAFLIGVLSLFWHSPAFPSCPAFQAPESSCCPVVPTIAMVTATLDNATPTEHGTVAPKHSETILKRSVESAAHEWRGAIHHEGRWFKDSQGRTLLLRGVNLCGSSKLPTSPYAGWTHLYDEKLFWDHRNVSFVGRPFPLDEAREHFARLRAWGLTLVRLLVPWESIEHKGPGEYDEEYIDYLRELISMMPEYGLKCFIDPHQDTWSRFSGGSGAPGWTFEVAGMDIRNFKETGAAYVHNTNAVPGDPLPMVWPTNYTKLASCTMFTLFFGGDTFAPQHRYNGQSIQQFLSQSFINAFAHLAERLKDMEAVLGFEVMNEPHPGYIGLDNLDAFDPIVNLIFGDSPTPLQCFALGDGIPQTVDVYVKSWPIPTRKSHSRLINANKVSAWLQGQSCIWKKHGVWDVDENGKPVLLDTKYFSKHPETGEPIEFYRDFYVPLTERYAQAIKNVKSDWYCFVEPLTNEKAPCLNAQDKNIVYAPHWYDLYCLFYKKFDARMTHNVQLLQNGGNVISATYFGRTGAKANYRGQIQNIKKSGLQNIGEIPCIIGEVGIPMDLNERKAFVTGDYKHHLHNMDAVMHALETNLVSFTLWNYDPCNDHEFGDQWNGENFSIYSSPKGHQIKQASINGNEEDLASLETIPNQQEELSTEQLHRGGRVLAAVIRPYAAKVSGTPIESRFDLDRLSYYFAFQPSAVATTTEIFVPLFHYNEEEKLHVQVSHGKWQYIPERQTLYHEYVSDPTVDTITIHIQSENPTSTPSKCAIM